MEALQVQVNKLETLGYNKIIALGHSGFNVDQQIAKRVRGVDVVIGGHTNTFLYTGISDYPAKVTAEPYDKPRSPTQTNLCLQEKLRPLKCRQVLTLLW